MKEYLDLTTMEVSTLRWKRFKTAFNMIATGSAGVASSAASIWIGAYYGEKFISYDYNPLIGMMGVGGVVLAGTAGAYNLYEAWHKKALVSYLGQEIKVRKELEKNSKPIIRFQDETKRLDHNGAF